jgi:hypothetical protein
MGFRHQRIDRVRAQSDPRTRRSRNTLRRVQDLGEHLIAPLTSERRLEGKSLVRRRRCSCISTTSSTSAGVTVVPVGPRAPNLNAFAERVVLSIKSECLDHFIVFGEAHLHYLVDEYLAHYHTERPHQGRDNLPLTGGPSSPRQEPDAAKTVEREQRLGGLLIHYRRAA